MKMFNPIFKKLVAKGVKIYVVTRHPHEHEGVEFWYKKIKDSPQVTIVAKPFLAPFSTPQNQVWFCTLLDPEGNCWQFVGKK